MFNSSLLLLKVKLTRKRSPDRDAFCVISVITTEKIHYVYRPGTSIAVRFSLCWYNKFILKISRLQLDMYIPASEKVIEGQGRILTHAKVFRSLERNRWTLHVFYQQREQQFSCWYQSTLFFIMIKNNNQIKSFLVLLKRMKWSHFVFSGDFNLKYKIVFITQAEMKIMWYSPHGKLNTPLIYVLCLLNDWYRGSSLILLMQCNIKNDV